MAEVCDKQQDIVVPQLPGNLQYRPGMHLPVSLSRLYSVKQGQHFPAPDIEKLPVK
jgi:hypothetical protein